MLEALTEPPAVDTVAVRTAAAAVEELCVLEMYSWGNKGSGDSSVNVLGGGEAVRGRTHASVVGDPALQALPQGGLWGPGTRNQRFAAMLTDAYARSAGTCMRGRREEDQRRIREGDTFLLGPGIPSV